MTGTTVPKIAAFGLSDTGKVREDNQDALKLCEEDEPTTSDFGYVFAIADGMGGYSHGGIASATALSAFFGRVYSGNPGQVDQRMRKAIQEANVGVYQQAVRLGVRRMGTTLTAVSILGNRMVVGHVGDSRAYLVRDGEARCITNDHTAVGDLVRMRVLSPDKVRHHAQRSVLNRCLGLELFVQPDISQVSLEPGDVIILCTDGVWSVIEDHEFGQLVTDKSDLETVTRSVIALALERDTDDNVSAVAIHAEELGAEPVTARVRRSFGFPAFLRSNAADKS
ncbi:MAG TPA: protein phosphatase 2C domain-containing protein [Aggregatilineales bacterium]|nr:protein phosphatase 2C domain-containing protein [Aggregatilineales bacterium]